MEDKKPVSVEVLSALNGLRDRSDQLLCEIGRIEVKKISLISEIKELNDRASSLLKQEGKRLGVPSGTTWSIDQDGNAIISPVQGQ